MADEDFVITGYTAKETINFLNQYHNDTEMQKYVLDTVSENTDVVLSKIEETRQAAAKIGMAFSDKLYDSENDFDPFVYDGSMSIEDFRKVQDSILSEQKENEKTFAEQVDDVISGKSNHYNDFKVCITCEWSESPAFEDGKTYTVAEFDSIMKQADDDWVKRRQYEIDTYGDDIDKIYEAFEKGEIENIHQGYAKTKFNVNMPDGTVHTFRQDIGDGDGGVIDFLKQYPQYSEVVRILEADIYLENHSDELLKPTLAFDEEVAITDEFFDFEKAWHNVDSGIPEIAERYRNGEDISIDLAKYFINHYVNLNNFNDYGKFEIHSDDNEVTIQNGEISKSYSWNELGEHYLSYLKDTFISIQTERVSEYPETKDEVEKLITSVKAEQKSENKTAKSNEKTFAEQVDEVLAGKASRFNDLKVCDTPQILIDVGCQQLPIFYTQRHLRDALKAKGNIGESIHHHGLTTEQIKKYSY